MKSCYIIQLAPYQIAIADICDYYGRGQIITRINVPEKFRGQGHGRELLKQIIADADREGVTLWLEILASGPLSSKDLEAWYKRYGFTGFLMYRRKPNKGVTP